MENTTEKQENRTIGDIYKYLAGLGHSQVKRETRETFYLILLELKETHGQILSTHFIKKLWGEERESKAKKQEYKNEIILKKLRRYLKEENEERIKTDFEIDTKEIMYFRRTTGERKKQIHTFRRYLLNPIRILNKSNGGL
jgi:hypothetical protein